MAFKMKGNPMQRNFGIGSPLHLKDVYIDGVLQETTKGLEKGLKEEKFNAKKRERNRSITTDEQNEDINTETNSGVSTTANKVDAGTIGNEGEKKTSKIVYVDGPLGNDATKRNELATGVNKQGNVTGKKVDVDQSATIKKKKK